MDNKNRRVILCESYASIAYVLYKYENEKVDAPVTVFITTLEDLYRLFQVLNEKVFDNSLELIFYPKYKQRWAEAKGIKKLLYILPDALGERRYLRQFYNKHFGQLKGADVFFPSPGYSGAKIYILGKLSKRNRIIYINPGPPYMAGYFPRNLKEMLLLFLYKILYGRNVQLGQYPPEDPWSKGFALARDSFMRRSVDSVIDWSDRDAIMENFPWEKYSVFDTGEHKVIYFHQDWVDRYVPDRDMFSRELNDVLNVVMRYYPEKEIARKYHPQHEFNKDVIEVGDEIPIYIPAELLYNDRVEVYLGISSTAITNVRGGQSISLLKIISLNDESIRNRFIERLVNNSRTEILFPESLEELDEILARISGKSCVKE